jgi:mRNA interferase MazF
MKRGDLVTIAMQGDYGKPRPALVIQADVFDALPSVTVLQITSEITPAHLLRILVEPSDANGLRKQSQIMVDRAMTIPRQKAGAVFGQLESERLREVSRALAAFLDLEAV